MIPCLAVIRVRRKGGRGVHLWIPLILVWLLLLPAALLAVPVFFLYCLIGRVSLVRAAKNCKAIFAGFKGTHVEVEDARHCVSLRIA